MSKKEQEEKALTVSDRRKRDERETTAEIKGGKKGSKV